MNKMKFIKQKMWTFFKNNAYQSSYVEKETGYAAYKYYIMKIAPSYNLFNILMYKLIPIQITEYVILLCVGTNIKIYI